MEKTVKIYNVNSFTAAINMKILLREPYFYWDMKRFIDDELGSEVFFISLDNKIAFYSILEKINIKSIYNKYMDSTNFIDENIEFDVNREWGDFCRFRVVETKVIPENWSFSYPLGNQNPIYNLYKYNSKLDDLEKRITKLEDLKIIFYENSISFSKINEIINLLEEILKTKKKSNIELSDVNFNQSTITDSSIEDFSSFNIK